MLNRIYRLTDVQYMEIIHREVEFSPENIIVKPDYLSICAADSRYYFGKRDRKVLNKKLPMALIHEAAGTVLHDCQGKLARGTKVVLVPNIEGKADINVKGNYRKDSLFASSSQDGFMQDVLSISRDRVIPIVGAYSPEYVLSELLSVAFNAVESLKKAAITPIENIGIWGDGNVAFAIALVMRNVYPKCKIYVFGKHQKKLQHFSFAENTFFIDDIAKDLELDHCFECVGGMGSEQAVNQIIEFIKPQGTISLLGVSENAISINTRKILDKGLILVGSSRSEKEDFKQAVELIGKNEKIKKYLTTIISEMCEVSSLEGIYRAFELDRVSDFKTVIKWNV